MKRGMDFPTGLVVVKATLRNDGGTKHCPDTSEITRIGNLLHGPRVLIATASNLLAERGGEISGAMYWCLKHDARLVILAAAPFQEWQEMHRRFSDRQPAATAWAMPTVELAEVLGVFVGVGKDPLVPVLRNGLCLVASDNAHAAAPAYHVVRHWAAKDNEAHDYSAMD